MSAHHLKPAAPFRMRALSLALVLVAAIAALPAQRAEAAGRGGSGRVAQGSVTAANRDQAARAGSRDTGRSGNNNVNIGNDVDIDIDVDRHHGWNDHHHPVAAGIVIGRMAVTRAAVVGAYYYAIPPGCTTVVRNGITYHYCGTVYYQRTWYGNDVVYVVVDL